MNDRLIILETLLLIEKGEDYGSRIIKDVLDKYAYLDRQHRSFIKRVLEGTLEIEINGRTVTGHQGDVIFIPKGSHIHFQTPSTTRYVYVTYPADWQ